MKPNVDYSSITNVQGHSDLTSVSLGSKNSVLQLIAYTSLTFVSRFTDKGKTLKQPVLCVFVSLRRSASCLSIKRGAFVAF